MARYLVTSALPYINGVKHLGNLAGSMLPADVYARFLRASGHETLFICATDEHGTPAELAALAEGVSVSEYCAKWHELQKSGCEAFRLSFDFFGRSSSAQNRRLTQAFAQMLWEGGFLEQRVTRQVFSNADKRFLPDRYVVGTCPHCGYEAARGDQCENCTRVLDPADLIRPRSAVSGSSDIEIRDSLHLFLRQSLFAEKIRTWIESKKGDWPHLVTSIALKWLDEGLQDRGITRDLTWGVPVNASEWGGDPDGRLPDAAALAGKVFYVWFDAPIEYIGATWEWADAKAAKENRPLDALEWERWWRLPEAADVTYVEFMGKDNVPFHTVGFPCTLFGVNERRDHEGLWASFEQRPWKLVDRLKGFNWLNYYGGKFSTSQKRGVFMDRALELLPSDYWRWYLTANAPEGADTVFTWETFQSAINSDLANVLGNFVNRITRYAAAKFDSRVPESGEPGQAEAWIVGELTARLPQLIAHYEAMEFRKAAAETRAIWAAGNEYLTRAEPWVKFKTDPEAAAVGVRTGLNLCALFGVLAQPIIPDAAETILSAVGVPSNRRRMSFGSGADYLRLLDSLPRGLEITPPPVLFAKIEDAQAAAWAAEFGGSG